MLAPHSLILYCLLALHSCYWPTRIGIIESNCKADDKIIPIIMLPLALPNQALRDASKLHCLQARSGTSPSLMSYILYCTPPPITRSPIPDPRPPDRMPSDARGGWYTCYLYTYTHAHVAKRYLNHANGGTRFVTTHMTFIELSEAPTRSHCKYSHTHGDTAGVCWHSAGAREHVNALVLRWERWLHRTTRSMVMVRC